MFGKYMMKNPILMIGILFVIIFLFQLKKMGYLDSRRDKFKSPACAAAISPIKKKVPSYWDLDCDEGNLIIEVTIKNEAKFTGKELQVFLYKEMANTYFSLAKMSPLVFLQKVPYVKVSVISDKNQIDGLSKGAQVGQMSTLNNPEIIANHIKGTVVVKEKIEGL